MIILVKLVILDYDTGPNLMTGVLLRRTEETDKQTQGRSSYEDGSRHWSDAARSQGALRILAPPEARKR